MSSTALPTLYSLHHPAQNSRCGPRCFEEIHVFCRESICLERSSIVVSCHHAIVKTVASADVWTVYHLPGRAPEWNHEYLVAAAYRQMDCARESRRWSWVYPFGARLLLFAESLSHCLFEQDSVQSADDPDGQCWPHDWMLGRWRQLVACCLRLCSIVPSRSWVLAEYRVLISWLWVRRGPAGGLHRDRPWHML